MYIPGLQYSFYEIKIQKQYCMIYYTKQLHLPGGPPLPICNNFLYLQLHGIVSHPQLGILVQLNTITNGPN